MRSPRVAELVAGELRARIVRGDLVDELPPEAALLDEFEVSRPSLREAFRILETEGLIQVRRGKIGGAVVRRPTPEAAAYHLGLVMQSEGARLSDLAESRLLIEPACAGLAAARDNHKSLANELSALIDENETLVGGGSLDFTTSARAFHRGIIDRCGNVTMRLMIDVLEAIWASQEGIPAEQAGDGAGGDLEQRPQRAVITAHRGINRQIARGDANGAIRAMRSDLEHLHRPLVGFEDAPIEVVPASKPNRSSRPGG